jgi:hypothetical protein
MVSGIIFSITPSFPKGQAKVGLTGPAFFPNLLALIFVACGVYQILYGFANKENHAAIDGEMIKSMFAKKETRTTYIILGLIVFFILFLNLLGFIVTTLVFLGVFLRRLGVSTLKTAMYSVIFTTTIYFLFGRLFTISLPSGILSYIGL